MYTNEFQNLSLSGLGMGCMRLPHLGKYSDVDQSAVEQMVAYAMEQGVNYYDTAWGYHDGNSEPSIGQALPPIPGTASASPPSFPATT